MWWWCLLFARALLDTVNGSPVHALVAVLAAQHVGPLPLLLPTGGGAAALALVGWFLGPLALAVVVIDRALAPGRRALALKLIDRGIGRRRVICNMSWEDPALGCRHLNPGAADTVLTLTSAGDNVLDYLVHGCARVVAADINPIQNHWLELRLAGIRALTADEFMRVFGESDRVLFTAVYRDRLRDHLSLAAAIHWDAVGPPVNWLYAGTSGALARGLLVLLRVLGGGPMLACAARGDSSRVRALWHQCVRPRFWGLYVWLGGAIGPVCCAPAGHDLQAKGVRILDAVFGRWCARNYFVNGYLLGRWTADCCPRYMRPEHFAHLKARLLADPTCVRLHTGTLLAVLRAYPVGHFTAASLLDHLDWLDSARVAETLRALWVAGVGRLWFRSGFEHRPPHHSAFWSMAGHHASGQDQLQGFYDGAFLAARRDDVLDAYAEPTPPAPSRWRDLATLGHMLCGAQLLYRPNDDSYRARTLDGARELMRALPLRDGDIWVDVGAGTGFNLERVRSALPRLRRVYLVGDCEPLLAKARERVERLGLAGKVVVVCTADVSGGWSPASLFLPEDHGRKANVVTFSYSLGMIPRWARVLTHAFRNLEAGGTVAVTDFDARWFQPNAQHRARLASLCAGDCAVTRSAGTFPFQCPSYVFIGRKPKARQSQDANTKAL